jgi:8-oxo-dGTP diphosphatase
VKSEVDGRNIMRQVTAAIMEKDGKILIAKRKQTSTLGGKWEFPGGKIELGETPEQCLKRELREEFGVEIEVNEFICSSQCAYSHIDIELMAYKAKYISGDFQLNVHDEIKWVNIDEARKVDLAEADRPILDKYASSLERVKK